MWSKRDLLTRAGGLAALDGASLLAPSPRLGRRRLGDHAAHGPRERIFGVLTPGASKLDPAASLCQFDIVLYDG